jgi:hypothetical protein
MFTEGQYCSAKDVILDECAVRREARKVGFVIEEWNMEGKNGGRTCMATFISCILPLPWQLDLKLG